jgi:hypothetical protein
MKDIMIDIETLALTPDATILSIGAVEFDATSMGREFYVEIDPKQGRALDPETCLWWAQQSSAFLDKRKPVLDSALAALAAFMYPTHKDGYNRDVASDFEGGVWANSPVFDLAILRNAFDRFLILACPWDYHQERDVRTAKAFVAKADRPEFTGTKHNALDDAKYQVLLVQKFLQETGLTL